MTKHTITYQLSAAGRAAALRAGLPAAEDQTIELGAEDVTRLLDSGVAPEATGEIQVAVPRGPKWGAGAGMVDGVPVSADAPLDSTSAVDHYLRVVEEIVAAQAAERAADDAAKAERRREEREAALAWVALPIDHRIDGRELALYRPSSSDSTYQGRLCGDGYPVVREHALKEHAPEALAETRAEIERRAQAASAEFAAKKAAEAAAKAASREAWVSWARDHGSDDTRAAIDEGYPLGQAVEREVVATLLPPAPEGTELDQDLSACDDGDRRVPSSAARAARQALADAVTAIPSDIVPDGTEIEVGRVRALSYYEPCPCVEDEYRCGECDDDREVKVRRTGIPVTIRAAHYDDTSWYLIVE